MGKGADILCTESNALVGSGALGVGSDSIVISTCQEYHTVLEENKAAHD